MTTVKHFLLRVQELSKKKLHVSQHCYSVNDDQKPKPDFDMKMMTGDYFLCLCVELFIVIVYLLNLHDF